MVDSPAPLVFVGLMATGKTTVAGEVAARTGWPVRDSDADIEAETGRTVDDLAGAEGTDALHRREAGHLLDAIASGRPGLVAAAASTIDDDRCLNALGRVPVVWLRAAVPTMVARFRSRPGRPDFGEDPEALLRRQLAARGPRFARVADLVVDVEGRAPAAIAEQVVAHFELPGPH